MISICEEVRLQQLRKAKYSILASILHILQNIFTEPHNYLNNTLCNVHYFLISCFEFGHILKKCDFLEKFISSLFFGQDPPLNYGLMKWEWSENLSKMGIWTHN